MILEALACGTPVVTTRQAGAAEVLDGNQAGTVLAEPGDAPALARALRARLQEGSPPDRDQIRETVIKRDASSWLRAMEKALAGLYESHRGT